LKGGKACSRAVGLPPQNAHVTGRESYATSNESSRLAKALASRDDVGLLANRKAPERGFS